MTEIKYYLLKIIFCLYISLKTLELKAYRVVINIEGLAQIDILESIAINIWIQLRINYIRTPMLPKTLFASSVQLHKKLATKFYFKVLTLNKLDFPSDSSSFLKN